jgi:hypothetical protein
VHLRVNKPEHLIRSLQTNETSYRKHDTHINSDNPIRGTRRSGEQILENVSNIPHVDLLTLTIGSETVYKGRPENESLPSKGAKPQ